MCACRSWIVTAGLPVCTPNTPPTIRRSSCLYPSLPRLQIVSLANASSPGDVAMAFKLRKLQATIFDATGAPEANAPVELWVQSATSVGATPRRCYAAGQLDCYMSSTDAAGAVAFDVFDIPAVQQRSYMYMVSQATRRTAASMPCGRCRNQPSALCAGHHGRPMCRFQPSTCTWTAADKQTPPCPSHPV